MFHECKFEWRRHLRKTLFIIHNSVHIQIYIHYSRWILNFDLACKKIRIFFFTSSAWKENTHRIWNHCIALFWFDSISFLSRVKQSEQRKSSNILFSLFLVCCMWSMWFVFIVWLQRRSKQWSKSSNIIKFGRYIFIRASQTAWDLYINFVLNIVANFARSVSVCHLFIGLLCFLFQDSSVIKHLCP